LAVSVTEGIPDSSIVKQYGIKTVILSGNDGSTILLDTEKWAPGASNRVIQKYYYKDDTNPAVPCSVFGGGGHRSYILY